MDRLAVIRKEDDAFSGCNGLKYKSNEGFVGIGYRFLKKHSKKGDAPASG